MRQPALLGLLLWVGCHAVSGMKNGLDMVPPMGWSNWLSFGCNIDEQLFRHTADALVEKGLRDAGYVTVGVDDCWAQLARNASGYMVANSTMFPSGMKALADYLHDRGLKLRIYSSAGAFTCQQNMSGSLGYEWLDAQLFASWGVDALKYDDCTSERFEKVLPDAPHRFPFAPPPILRYPIMGLALNRTGRNISYMCNFPWDLWKMEQDQSKGGMWVQESCNSWRTGADSRPGFDYSMAVVEGAEHYADLLPSGPGGWNHLDAMQIGNTRSFLASGELFEAEDARMTEAQEQVLFSLYALVKTPLMIGADVITLAGSSLATYLNKEVIAVNQDPLGARGRRVLPVPGSGAASPGLPAQGEVWRVLLSDGGVFAVLLNRQRQGAQPVNISTTWTDLGLEVGASFVARDVWRHLDIGVFAGTFSALVAPQSCVAVRLRKAQAWLQI